MLEYDDYIKHWPTDYGKSRLQSLYMEYLITEMYINKSAPAPEPKANQVCTIGGCWMNPTGLTVTVPAFEAPKKSRFGAKACKQEQEVENTMTTYNETEASRKYLLNRVQNVYWSKRDDLAIQFRIHNSDTPRTYKELIDAIKNDKYTLDTKRTAQIDTFFEDDDWYGNAFEGIEFDLPTAPDREGYTAATAELDKKVLAAKDVINVGTPADGLKALQELEAWTFTKASA